MQSETSRLTVSRHVKHGSRIANRKICVGLKVVVCVSSNSFQISSNNFLEINLAFPPRSASTSATTIPSANVAIIIKELVAAAISIVRLTLSFFTFCMPVRCSVRAFWPYSALPSIQIWLICSASYSYLNNISHYFLYRWDLDQGEARSDLFFIRPPFLILWFFVHALPMKRFILRSLH